MRVSIKSVIFVMVDIQEKFKKHISDIDKLVKNVNMLNKFSEIMELPLLVTEQYPEGLGKTLDSIYLPAGYHLFTKNRFSIFEPHIEDHLDLLQDERRFLIIREDDIIKKHLVFYGIETHVCIIQSVLEALEKNYKPIVVADAVSSISGFDHDIALDRIKKEGATIVSTEMLLFELLRGSFHPHFKEVSRLVKDNKTG